MGGLSSGPGPGICFLTLCLLILAQQSQSAPVQEDNLSQQSRAQGYYDGSSSELSSGCYYNFQHYGEGDRIITNEPCLNCTCRNRMLMCYLRVCPFTKAIGQNCTIEKKPGQCCPLIICPEVPVQLLTSSTTTEHSESMSHKTQLGYGHHGTGVGHLDDYGCKINGEFYTNGAQIPGNIDKPCEVCYCIRNRTACIMQECTLQVDGCIPVYEEGLCCPVRYQCDYEYSYNAITTEQPRPTPGLVLTTTSGPFECQHDGKWYADGSSVDTEDPCEHCYCMKGDIVCAVQECKPPFEKDGHNCTAMPPAPGKCCPDSYHCANVTMSITSSTSSSDKHHHGWNYGTNANDKDTPNRFTDEQNKDGTTGEDGHMMITEGIPPTLGPLESGSHHLEGHYDGKPVSEGHGVNTDNMLTISQVIQSIVHNQTQLLNQNRLNQSMAGSGEAGKHPGSVVQDDKIHFPTDDAEDGKRPPFHYVQTDEDGNPLESHSVTELPEDYYGFTGGSLDIYAEHSGRPQTRPTKPSGGTKKPQPAQAIFGEHGHFGRPIERPGTAALGQHEGTDGYQGTTDLPEGYTGQPGKKPITHKVPGVDGTSVMTDEFGNAMETVTGLSEGFTGKPGTVVIYYDENGRPHKRPVGHKQPGSDEGVTEVYEGVTGSPEGFTDRPGSVGTYLHFDEHGRPHVRPVGHKTPGGIATDGETSTGLPEGFTGKPGDQSDIYTDSDHSGRPLKKPVVRPGMTDEAGATEIYDESTGYPEGFTGRPGTHSRPGSNEEAVTGTPDGYSGHPGGVHKHQQKPSVHAGSEMEDGMTGVYEGTTEISDGYTSHHDLDKYGEHGHGGRPQKRPGTGEAVTNKDGTLVEGVTKVPGQYDYSDIFGEHGHTGRPHKKPGHGPDSVKVTTDEEGNVIDGMTVRPDGQTGSPDGEMHYGEHGRPKPGLHKKPGEMVTDENGNEIETVTGSPDYHTGKPDADGWEVVFDKYGRPHRRPVHTKPAMDAEETTGGYGQPLDETEGTTDTQPHGATPDFVVTYDEQGRPIKTPVQKVPGMHTGQVPIDKGGKPVEGMTEIPEAHTGRPHGKPVHGTSGPEGVTVMTDEDGKVIDGMTVKPDGHTARPDGEVHYDEHGGAKPEVHKKPDMSHMTPESDEHGKPLEQHEIMTESPESQTGKPESDSFVVFFDQYGRPHRHPVHKKPGGIGDVLTDEEGNPLEVVTGTDPSFTDRPETPGFFGEHGHTGRPHKRPGMTGGNYQTEEYEGTTGTPDEFTGKPGTQGEPEIYGEHGHTGRPHKRPVSHKKPGTQTVKPMDEEAIEHETRRPGIHHEEAGRPYKKPGMDVSESDEETTELSESHTGRPESDGSVPNIFSEHGHTGRPHKRPVHQKKPGMTGDVMTDEDGNPIDGVTSQPEDHVATTDQPGEEQTLLGKPGRPHKRPTTQKRPGMKPGMTDEEASGPLYDEEGRPLKKPVHPTRPQGSHDVPEEDTSTDGVYGTTELPDGYTSHPLFGEQGHKGKPFGHTRPTIHGVSSTEAGEDVTGTPDSDDKETVYDEHGRPVKPTFVHKKPDEDLMTDDLTGATETPEGQTEAPIFMIVYDKNGRPIKKPIRRKPGMHGEHTPTDKYGKPIEGMTETPEGHTGTPDSDDETVYDQHGRPVKRPIYTKPGMHDDHASTDKYGKPVEDKTETPEEHTDNEVFYDKYGNPLKPTDVHKKPGMDAEHTPTDKYGKPVHGVTKTPEGSPAAPESDEEETVYDQHGRPVKRPITHNPDMDSEHKPTDEYGQPVEGVTETPGQTDTPDYVIMYDNHGRPIKMPVHKTPGMHPEYMPTDKDGKPVEGVTEAGEGHTETPEHDDYVVFYDQFGRPHKIPVGHKRPVLTDDSKKPLGGEGHTGKPDDMTPVYDEHGKPVHKKPGTSNEDAMTDEHMATTEEPGAHTETPEFVIVYDQHGRPIKKPVHKQPGMGDEYGKPVEGLTETPEGHTGVPDSTDRETFYDENGRPVKRPVHVRPGMHDEYTPTDKYGKPVEGMTETPKEQTLTPESDQDEPVYDQFGRPLKRPIHGKPGMDDATTEEYGKPGEESPENETGRPGTVGAPEIFGEHGHTGRPHKKPVHVTPGPDGVKVTTDEEGNVIDGMTVGPESHTGRPDEKVHYDEHGRPKPDDEHVKPSEEVEGTTATPESQTGTPDFIIIYDKNGRPYKKPIRKRPGMHGEHTPTDQYGNPVEGMTETPEGHTGAPGSADEEVFYDKYGNPIASTVFESKPETTGEAVMTDEDGKPLEEHEGTTATPGTPDFMIVYDKNGRPIKKPIRKRPGMHGEHTPTDKYGKPVEGMTETPERHTSTPGNDDETVYDQHGRPVKRPIHGKPGMDDATTEEYGKPGEESPENETGRPGMVGAPEIFGEHEHTGRPHKKPVHVTLGPDGVKVTTDDEGNLVEGMTETPEGQTGKPEGEVNYDEHGRPIYGVHAQPDDATDDDGKPVHGTPETEEDHVGKPDGDGIAPHHGEPQEKPVDEHEHPLEEDHPEGHTVKPGVVHDVQGRPQEKPDEPTSVDEHGHPVHGFDVVTMVPEETTDKLESDSHQKMPDKHVHKKPEEKPDTIDSTGQTHETPDDHKKPGAVVGDDTMTPGGTETPDRHTGRPGSDDEPLISGEHGHTGRPHTRPVKPGAVGSQDATETPEGDHTTASPVIFDEDGKPVGQKGPQTTHEEQPQGSILHEDDHHPHKRPEDVEEQPTDAQGSTTVTPQEGLGPHSKPEDAHEGTDMSGHKTPEMEDDHATESPEDGSTGRPRPTGVEIYLDEFGRPRPVHTHPTSSDGSNVDGEVPEGFTGRPGQESPGLFGEPSHTGRPQQRPETQPVDDQIHTTEVSEGFTGQPVGTVVHYDEQGKPLKKPEADNELTATKEPEKDADAPYGVTEPQLFGEYGRPHKKPLLKPGPGVVHEDDHTHKQPGVPDLTGIPEESSTGKPDHDSPITLFGESGRPTKKPIKPVHDDHKPDEERPEENEISDGNKTTELPEGVTGKPEGTKVAEPTHGIDKGTDGSHPDVESATEHPEGIWQYLPPKKPDTHYEPGVTTDNEAHVKPVGQTTDGMAPEEDDDEDDSLIITTDESEEEEEDVHGHTSEPEGADPTDIKTKIPEESGKPHEEVHPTTPGLGSHSQDFTTPGYGTQDSSLLVTDGATHGHPVTHGLDGHPDLSHLGPDGVSFPGANVAFDKDGKPHIIPGKHSGESAPELGHAQVPVTTLGYEDVAAEEDDSTHDTERPESATVGKPEGGSTPGVTVVFDEDGKPHIVPVHETSSDVKGKPSGHPEEGKPSTPEGTTKKPSDGYFPGIPAGFLPSFSETGTPNTDAPIMIDGGLNEGSPFDEVLDTLVNVLRPMHTTEKAAETTEEHKEVPGEGSCFMDGVTYPNNSEVPPLNPCHTQCTCVNSIIHCLSLKCPSPPEDVSHCTTVHDEKSCCPTYICDDSSTSPVEGHEATTVHEDEEGSLATETPMTPEHEDGEHTPVKAVTQQSEMDADKPSEGKPLDEEHPVVTETEEEPHGEIHHAKPEVDHAHPVDHSETEEPGTVIPGPAGIEMPTEDGQTPSKGAEGSPETQESHVKPVRPHIPQSGYLPPASTDEHRPSTSLPSYFGVLKPITGVEEHTDHQTPDSEDQVLGTDEPMTDKDKIPGHGVTEEEPATTDVHKPHEGIVEPESPTKVTGEEAAMPDGHSPMKKPSQEPEHHKPTESGHPTTDEQQPEQHKPHGTVIDDHHPTTHDGSALSPHEKPEESSPTKKKPQDDHEPAPGGEETGDHTTYKPEDGAKPLGEHEDSHKKPGVATSAVGESELTTTSPQERPTGDEKPEVGTEEDVEDQKPSVTGEEGTHEEPSDKKPSHDPMTTDMPESGHVTSKIPVTHDTDGTHSEEDKDHKHTMTTDRPEEQGHTHATVDEFGRPIITTGHPEESQPEHGSTDKVHPSTEQPTDHSTSEDEEHHKKPESATSEDTYHSTPVPEDDFATGKPMVPSEIFTDSHKKPEADGPEGHEPVHGMTERPHPHTEGEEPQEEGEAPHKKPEDSASPMDEHSTHTTTRPQGQPSAGVDGKPETFHPSSADESETSEPHGKPMVDVEESQKPQTGQYPASEDSLHTTGRPQDDTFEGQEPHVKPEVDSHTSSTHETGHFTTARPHEEPTGYTDEPHRRPQPGEQTSVGEEDGHTTSKPHEHAIEEPHKRPEESKPEDDLMQPATKQPTEAGQEVPQTDMYQPGVFHSTTEGVMVDGQPDHDFASTVRPKPGQSTPTHVSHKPKPEVIPDEILLHPTRTPGTFQTQRPDMEPDQETTDHQPNVPETDDTLSTFIPEGLLHPVTKRPTIGAGKPGDKIKDSTTYQPETEAPEGTRKPVHDIATDLPDNLAEIFGNFRPTPTPGQTGEKPDFGDFLPGTGIFQKPDLMKPDEDLGEPEETIPDEEIPSQYTTVMPAMKPKPGKRPIYSTNGTHFIQYVPVKEDEAPHVPQGAILGEPEEGPDGDKYWPIIFVKQGASTTEPTAEMQKPTPQQVFNGTHFIQYLPFEDGETPEVPEGATLGQPVRKPDGQVYWPIIDIKPLPFGAEDEPVTQGQFPGQVYNGTHFIQYLSYDQDKPEIPEGATLGQPETAPNGEKFWPIISTKPIPDAEGTTTGSPEQQPEQIFNGTHFIQYVPFKNGEEPEIPEDATLGQPQKGPDGQIYWPIINTKPIPVTPSDDEPATNAPPVQVFNGTNFIQYVPFKDGEPPEVPEGATLGQPQKTPDGEIYWPIIYAKPQPVKPEGSLPSQVFNGTHFIQYVPYEEGKQPEVPEDATLGQPQKTPDGQTFWPLIYTKPVTTKPEDEPVFTEEPFKTQLFNGTHYIQYIPFTEGFEPQLPEEATVGEPVTRPDGQKYWSIIYEKLPTTVKPEEVQPQLGQVYNGTHFIKYVPYRPNNKPKVPEEATVGKPVKGKDGEMYWPIISLKPLPELPEEPVKPQVFNGTHYIQYVPYEEEKPEVPEGAVLGEPETRPDGQKYRPVISKTPLPGLPITTPEGQVDDELPVTKQVFNGTHYIQLVPYMPGKRPVTPEGATLGKPTKGPNDQMYWPIISKTPVPGLPVTTQSGPFEETAPTAEPVTQQVFNGTHYIQYVPYKPDQRPVPPEGSTLGKPVKGPNDQKYWPIIYQSPVPGLPIVTEAPFEDEEPTTEPINVQFHNGTHYIQYVPYKPGKRPVVPEDAVLGNPTRRPDNQLYWPIIRLKPVEGLPIATQHGPVEDDLPTSEPVTEQVFNGTHYIQYVPYRPGQRPVIPEEATLGNPTKGPDNQLYWPIIYLTPVPDLPIKMQTGPYEGAVTTAEPVTQQAHNGTHLVQYIPYKSGQRPVVPEGATLGTPTTRPDGETYWPLIFNAPLPVLSNASYPFEGPAATTDPANQQAFNGTHYIQYLPYKPGQRPLIPEGATLGKPTKAPNDEMFWPIIYQTPIPGLPIKTQEPTTTKKPFIGQVFNGTHYIQYLPFESGQKPMIPEGATLGKPTKGPNDQMYYPIIHSTPSPGVPIATEQEIFEDTTTEPITIQVFNGTHYIHYVPYKPGHKPMIPEDASLGKPTKGPNDQMYWPVIYSTPVSGPVTTEEPAEDVITISDPTKNQVYNGTHYIQYVPYRPMQRPVIPTESKLGKPTSGPNGQLYWPIIHLQPVPGLPIVAEKPFEEQAPEKGQFFNGTHYIQYVPYTSGHKPVVPEGAILGHPETKSNGEMYWPIIRLRPAPGIPIKWMPYEYTTPRPEQIFNGTHYIQYVPYNPTQMPEVPEGATLGHPQKGPGDQMYWVIISDKPIPDRTFNGSHVVQYVTPVTPEQGTYEYKPSKPLQLFNGTHYIQYVPYTPGQRPVVPEGAVLGKPTTGPEGETYWPIVYKKRPVGEVPSTAATPEDGQIFNGTHFIRYVPYNPSKRPKVPEGATISNPQKRPDGQIYWVISSRKPLPVVEYEPVPIQHGQIYNGTHYIQYVPYNPSQIPQVPDGAVLGHPQKGPNGQMSWVIISDKPLPAQPGTQYVQYVTPVTPEENKFTQGLTHNGTHYIQYVPYKQAQIPHIPNDATLGDLEQGPGGQMYWPIIFSKMPQGPIFNGTHYVTYAPQTNATHVDNSTKDHPFWDYGQYGGTKVKPSTTESYPTWSKPGHNATKYPTQEQSKPGYNEYEPGYNKPDKRPGGEDSFEAIDEDHLIEYPSGSDYDETQEQPYGPGTCRYAGKVYVSAQQIPRDDPCDFCFCFRSDIICLQQSCPPPIPGCHEEPIQGFCCPRYECHVRMATLLNVTSTTTTTTTTLPPHFLSHVYNGAAGRTGCFVQGKAYRVGQPIPSASGPCMDCICGGDGKMKCEPKVCSPEPMVRQMMVSTEKTMSANHR